MYMEKRNLKKNYKNIKETCNNIAYFFFISSSVWTSGDKPPWTQRNCWFMRAASGRQSNASIQASYTRSVYLILPEIINNWIQKRQMKNIEHNKLVLHNNNGFEFQGDIGIIIK